MEQATGKIPVGQGLKLVVVGVKEAQGCELAHLLGQLLQLISVHMQRLFSYQCMRVRVRVRRCVNCSVVSGVNLECLTVADSGGKSPQPVVVKMEYRELRAAGEQFRGK